MTIGEAFAEASRRAGFRRALLELADGILADTITPGEIDERLAEIRKQFLTPPGQASDVPPPPGPISN